MRGQWRSIDCSSEAESQPTRRSPNSIIIVIIIFLVIIIIIIIIVVVIIVIVIITQILTYDCCEDDDGLDHDNIMIVIKMITIMMIVTMIIGIDHEDPHDNDVKLMQMKTSMLSPMDAETAVLIVQCTCAMCI